MYNNLIYFLLVLVVFTTTQPSEEMVLPWWTALGLNFLLLLFFRLLAGSLFGRLRRGMEAGRIGAANLSYTRLVNRLSIVALGLFAVNVLLLQFKDLVLSLPLIGGSTALSGLLGLAFFALYLALLWSEAFAVYVKVFPGRMERSRFVLSQIRFNLPIILPWLILSAVLDLIGLMPESGLRAWLESPLGEIVYFAAFISVLVVLFPLLIRPLWGLKPLEPGPSRTLIESFCRRHGFFHREIMLWPLYEGEALTAGVMGLTKRLRYLLVTRALLRVLDPDELEAVVAHELGHVKQRHLLFYLFFFLGYLVLAYALFDLNTFILLLSDRAMDLLVAAEGQPDTTLSFIMSLPIIVLMIVYFRYVMGFFLRNLERQADLYAYRITGEVGGLVRSLEKIAHFSGQSRSMPSWHHFSVAQRVDYLERARVQPGLVTRHDRKVRLMIAAYCLALVVIGWGGYALQEHWLSGSQASFATRALQAELRRHPDNDEAFRMLGDIQTQMGHPDEAIQAYHRALAINPEDPETLNKLAWTLATRSGATDQDKRQALELARRAADLLPAAPILDTLAEALFINGRTREAVAAIEQALVVAGPNDDLDYYRRQKSRFLGRPGEIPAAP